MSSLWDEKQLDYGEGAEQVSDLHIHENISNGKQKDNDQQDQDYITTSKEVSYDHLDKFSV